MTRNELVKELLAIEYNLPVYFDAYDFDSDNMIEAEVYCVDLEEDDNHKRRIVLS